jgi:hypothetical protein
VSAHEAARREGAEADAEHPAQRSYPPRIWTRAERAEVLRLRLESLRREEDEVVEELRQLEEGGS